MVAKVRGKANRSAKARARAPVKSRSASRASKFRASSGGAGLPPKVAMGAAVIAVAGCLGLILFTGERMASVGRGAQNAAVSALAGAGFKIKSIEIAGASLEAAEAIAEAIGVRGGQPLFSVDLAQVRANVEQVGWVEEATVMRMWPGAVMVRVTERTPVAVWQMDGLMRVIDGDGEVIREADPAQFAELPLVVGQGANETGGAVFAMIAERPRLSDRLEAMVRVDQRRWDLRLKDGSIIQLPAVDEAAALIRLDQLDQGQQLLDLGFERIDLRTEEMIVVRGRDGALSGDA
jgi:cell division protein FtsQ